MQREVVSNYKGIMGTFCFISLSLWKLYLFSSVAFVSFVWRVVRRVGRD